MVSRKILNKELRIFLALAVFAVLLVQSALAADPGHGAASVGGGTFEAGNFIFPNNLTINNNLLVGGNNFFVNNATGYVGIGTSSPTHKLNVVGNANITTNLTVGANLFVNQSSVGIGTSSPSSLLTLYSFGTNTIKMTNNQTNYANSGTIDFLEGSGTFGTNDYGFRMTYDGNANKFYIDSAAGGASSNTLTILRSDSNGYVGIGTTAPSSKFEVAKVAGTNEVNLSGVLYVNSTSNRIGIGTTSPTHTLNILGTTNITGLSYFGANLSMGGFQINNLGTPSLSTDAATKAYVDSITGGGGSTTWSLASGTVYLNNSLNNVSIGSTNSLFKLGVVGDIGITNGSLWQPVYPSDDGLVLYLPFSEGTGTTTYDKSPYGNDGTITGATWTTGKYGNALSLNGLGDYVNIGDLPILRFTNESNFTISSWINKPGQTNGTAGNPIFDKFASQGYRLYEQRGALRFDVRNSTSGISTHLTSFDVISNNTWTYVAVTFSQGRILLYADGIMRLNATAAVALSNGTTSATVGRMPNNPDAWFNGTIDEVKVYNRALSADEIRTQYLSGMQSHGYTIADKFRIINTTASKIFEVNNTGLTISTGPTISGTSTGIGIGTTSPSSKFEVAKSAGTNEVNLSGVTYVNSTSSRVGIGTSSPSNKLDVRGDLNVSAKIYFNNASDISVLWNNDTYLTTYNSTYANWSYNQTLAAIGVNNAHTHNAANVTAGTFAAGNFAFQNNLSVGGNFTVGTNTLFVNKDTGFVGIGTSSPQNKFQIYNGSLEVSGIYSYNVSRDSVRQGSIYLSGTASNLQTGYGSTSPSFVASYGGLELRSLAGTNASREQQIIIDEPSKNLVTNPSLETAATNWSFWVNSGGGWGGRVTEDSYSGAYSWKTNVSSAGSIGNLGGCADVSNYTNYTLSAWVKVAGVGATAITFYAREFDGKSCTDGTGTNRNLANIFTTAVLTNGTDGWVRISKTFQTTVSGQSLALSWYLNNVQDITYVDAIQIENKDYATTYMDGSLGAGYSWTGTAHASYSLRNSTILMGGKVNKSLSVYDTGVVESTLSTYLATKSGNVGIGTSSPSNKLDVRGDLNVSAKIYFNNASDISVLWNNDTYLTTYNSTYAIWAYNQTLAAIGVNNAHTHNAANVTAGTFAAGNFAFQNNLSVGGNFTVGTNTLFVNKDTGFVGIGTTSPGAQFEVHGTFTRYIQINASDAIDVSGKAQIKINEFVPGIEFNDASAGGDDFLLFANGNRLYIANKTGSAMSSSNLFSVGTDGTVGIGTSSPSTKLAISGNFSTTTGAFLATSSGNVGIGTTDPTQKLSIKNGAVYVERTDGGVPRIFLNQTWVGVNTTWSIYGSTARFAIGLAQNENEFNILSNGLVGIGTSAPAYLLDVRGNVSLNSTLFVTNAGNVGIGTSSPTQLLDVRGNINVSAKIYFNNASDISVLWNNDTYLTTYNSTYAIWAYNQTLAALGVNNAHTHNAANVTAGTFAAGNFAFQNNLSVGGNFTVGTNTLFVNKDTGNVGIGTSTPTANSLTIQVTDTASSTGGNALVLKSDTSATTNKGGAILFTDTGSPRALIKGAYIGPGSAGYIAFSQANSSGTMVERMRIDGAAGNVGVGTSSPSSKFEVAKSAGTNEVNLSGVLYVNSTSGNVVIVLG
jgi:hypothetical protein